MQTLYFQNPQFHEGLNLTVRRGVSWNLVKNGDVVNVVDTNNPSPISAFATIKETRVMRFQDLRNADLALEHDETCRKVKGLAEVMKQVYPGFDEREIVTLVFFE